MSLLLCIIAMITRNRRVQMTLLAVSFLYQVSFIVRLYGHGVILAAARHPSCRCVDSICFVCYDVVCHNMRSTSMKRSGDATDQKF